MVRGGQEGNALRSALLWGDEQTIIDLPLPEFEWALVQLDKKDLEELATKLEAAMDRANRKLDRATRDWQERGEGLPNWYAASFKSILALERKIERVSSERKGRALRERGNFFDSSSLTRFEENVAQHDHGELAALKRNLDSTPSVHRRGEKIQIVQKYLTLRREERKEKNIEEAKQRDETFAKVLVSKMRAMLDEQTFYALLHEARKAVENSEVPENSPFASDTTPLAERLVELETQVNSQADALKEMDELETQLIKLQEEEFMLRTRYEELQSVDPEAKQASKLLSQIRGVIGK